MAHANANPATGDRGARQEFQFGRIEPALNSQLNDTTQAAPQVWSLYQGRSGTPLVRIVRDERSQLYRIAWPDTGFSPPANLARCMDAAAAWAERSFIAKHRNLCVARRLKSLNFFWRSASPVRQNGGGGS